MEYNLSNALKDLQDSTAKKRFEAVKFFLKNKHPEIKDKLEKLQNTEKVKYIKIHLKKAINLLENLETEKKLKEELTEEKIIIDDNTKNYLKALAIDEFSGVILHELEPKIGILKSLLEKDIPNYNESRIKLKINDFEQFFISLRNLRKSTDIPVYSEVRISELIKEIYSEESKNYHEIEINFEGQAELIIKIDRYLLSIIISNGIRNALESLKELPADNKKRITISWGTTNIDIWISISDEGIGLKDSSENAFKLGNTTKSSHTGFGLSIIEQAINSLLGEVQLSNSHPRGAKLTIRLPNND